MPRRDRGPDRLLPAVGTLVEFANGRSLLLFSAQGTLYSFSGSCMEDRGSNTVALVVDTVRIASAMR